MTRARARVKAFVFVASALGLVTLTLFVALSRESIIEKWYLWRLGSGDTVARREAARQLGELRAVEGVPLLAEAVESADRDLALSAIVALGLIGSPSEPAVGPLAAALDDSDPRIKIAATKALIEIGPPGIRKIVHGLRDSREFTRASSVFLREHLIGMGSEAVPVFAAALEAKHPRLRISAALALTQLGEAARGAIPSLRVALRDDDASVRGAAVRALGAIGPDSASSLGPSLGDEDRWVRKWAVEALVNMGKACVAPVIQFIRAECARVGQPRFVDEELPETVQGAATVLQSLDGAAVGPLIECSTDGDTMVRRVIVGVLARMGSKPPDVIRALRAAENDPDVAVSHLATIGLRRNEQARRGEP